MILRILLLLVLFSAMRRPFANSAKFSCKTCKDFVSSFNEGMERTSKSNYAGGDTSWEEEKLGSYSNSEVRLVEVLDTVCTKSDYDCHRLLEVSEEDVERWWFKLRKQDNHKDMEAWLCYSHLDVCCPENTFGPKCEDCPGGPDSICGGRGKCLGAGEKDGTGKCSCDTGYDGGSCQSCASNYYLDNNTDSDKLECKACDMSCSKSCDGPGPGGCEACADGYKDSEDGVCEDIDECKMDPDAKCREGTFCFNTPGTFRCNDCDKACKKICHGFGPSKCAECASGYTRDEHGVCKDDNECEQGVASCHDGTYCENSPGKYICKACHVACLGGCHGAGTGGCVACKEGYVMGDTDGCKDINECESDPSPCDQTTEVCSNLVGSYVCKCAEDLVRGENGECVTEPERKKQRDALKEKKKKRKKKKAKKADKPEGEGRNGNNQNGKEEVNHDEQSVEDPALKRPEQQGDEILDQPIHVGEHDDSATLNGGGEQVGIHDSGAPSPEDTAELLHNVDEMRRDSVDDSNEHHTVLSDHLDGQEPTGNVIERMDEEVRDEL